MMVIAGAKIDGIPPPLQVHVVVPAFNPRLCIVFSSIQEKKRIDLTLKIAQIEGLFIVPTKHMMIRTPKEPPVG